MIHLFHAYKMQRIRVISADLPGLASKASTQGIDIYNIAPVDELTWEIDISSEDFPKIKGMIENTGGQTTLLRTTGIGAFAERLKKRPIFIAFIVIIFGLTLLLPNWIFFVQVEGNNEVPTHLILEVAEMSGVGFGTYRRGIRSEKIKNSMLSNIPALSWVGVNTRGCVATISVREGEPVKERENTKQVCSIVASRDGVISELTVLRGTALCKVGSAVQKGDVLISGYTDSGLLIRGEAASGEVFAKTQHQFSAISDASALVRQAESGEKRTYWLLVGKKLIKLWKDSGISDATCVKMYEIEYLTLPGGFQLPLGILVQKEIPYAYSTQNVESAPWLEDRCRDYLLSQMNAGRIQSGAMLPVFQEDIISAECNYTCHEMIGRVRYEETVINYGKSD